jgi:hypothetical protein
MQYFSLRSFGQYNTPQHIWSKHPEVRKHNPHNSIALPQSTDSSATKIDYKIFHLPVEEITIALQRIYGLYTAEDLAKKPFTCSLPSLDDGPALNVNVTAEYRPAAAAGQGAGTTDEIVSTRVNGKDLSKIDLQDSKIGIITASGNGIGLSVSKCIVETHAPLNRFADKSVPARCSKYDTP